jgi:hypothetical protein
MLKAELDFKLIFEIINIELVIGVVHVQMPKERFIDNATNFFRIHNY